MLLLRNYMEDDKAILLLKKIYKEDQKINLNQA